MRDRERLLKNTFLKSKKYKLSNDMQHSHVHLDLPFHSYESPTVFFRPKNFYVIKRFVSENNLYARLDYHGKN